MALESEHSRLPDKSKFPDIGQDAEYCPKKAGRSALNKQRQ